MRTTGAGQNKMSKHIGRNSKYRTNNCQYPKSAIWRNATNRSILQLFSTQNGDFSRPGRQLSMEDGAHQQRHQQDQDFDAKEGAENVAGRHPRAGGRRGAQRQPFGAQTHGMRGLRGPFA